MSDLQQAVERLDELHANTTRGAWYAEPSFAELAENRDIDVRFDHEPT